MVCPGRYCFPQGAIYRLKLANIPGPAGHRTVSDVGGWPGDARTEAFLAHNTIPVQFTPEDFDQVLSGNFVTKVIYLPDPEFQELALAGVETLVSTRLDPGVDPIVEADRRGAILAIVRLGNKDLQAANCQPQEGGVAAASYDDPQYCPRGPMAPMPMGMCAGRLSTMPMGFIAGVTAPQYGMPMCGTPIGLPGPPSVPLGVPAGLKQHTIVNRTAVHLPKPTEKVKVVVKEKPGYSYPKPVRQRPHRRTHQFGRGPLRATCGRPPRAGLPDGPRVRMKAIVPLLLNPEETNQVGQTSLSAKAKDISTNNGV